MKKLYLILLMLLLLFIPTSVNAVAIYQLDQPVSELNGHTLREVYDIGNNSILGSSWSADGTSIITIDNNGYLVQTSNNSDFYMFSWNHGLLNDRNYYMYSLFYTNNDFSTITFRYTGTSVFSEVKEGKADNEYFMSFKGVFGSGSGALTWNNKFPNATTNIVSSAKIGFIDLTYFGIENLTKEQLDKYYNLYLEAVRFEQENIQASQDLGGYQNIFKSIINGVKNLMTEMGNVWQFLNAPIMTSDIRDFKFEIDWSWDLIGMLGQVLSSVQVLTLQVVLLVPSLVFQLFGIPIQVSILSLLFSNFIFLVLGWIIVKSFLI